MSDKVNTNQLMDTEPGGENTQYESQKTFTEPPSKPKGVSQFRDEEGTVHLPTHRKTKTGDIKAKAEGSKEEEGEEGTKHLPTHNKVRPGDIKAKAEEGGKEEKSLEDREKQGYGEGSGVGA